MIEKLYYIILGLFGVGAILMAIINFRNPSVNAKNNWTKYFTYFLIVNAIITSILFNLQIFKWIIYLILGFSLFELVKNTLKTKKYRTGIASLMIFFVLAYSLYQFSGYEKEALLFTYFVITIFDAFCQLSGQLFGRTKILPKISPNKTLEGLAGGLLFALLASIFIRETLDLEILGALLLGIGISVFAFVGDLLASFSKRSFGIKDFSQLLPGHGGFLDRFDSLFFAAFLIYILKTISIL